MTWPQIIVLMWFVLRCVVGVRRMAADKDLTSGAVTFGVFMTLGIEAGLVYVLHAGGFW